MHIKRVHAVYFSPVGKTRLVVTALAGEIAHLLGVPLTGDDLTLPAAREDARIYEPDELVVFGTPTYAGRIPNKLLPAVKELFTDGTYAVALTTFGNRSFDDSLSELRSVLTENGFCVIAGAAIAAQHAFSETLAADRPDADDLARISAFAAAVCEKIKRGDDTPCSVRGRDPVGPYYTPRGLDGEPKVFLKAKPVTDKEKCRSCGLCAAGCPMGSISTQDYASVTGICIKCHACVKHCPVGAKYFDDEAFLSHKAMLERDYTRRAEPEFFI